MISESKHISKYMEQKQRRVSDTNNRGCGLRHNRYQIMCWIIIHGYNSPGSWIFLKRWYVKGHVYPRDIGVSYQKTKSY